MNAIIPVVLFAYVRPDHLRQTLACLRENCVPLIYAFSDGARTLEQQAAVDEVRQILRAVDWCEIVLTERNENWGLGRSVLSGVEEVFKQHDAIIVFEDDLICVPGTYQYLCAALEHYRDDQRVMSVTGYTHPSIRPNDIGDSPYFDGRFSSWCWGTWARSWMGMDQTAVELLRACEKSGIDPAAYGEDLPPMAKQAQERNLWAVRFAYLHILKSAYCLHPPHSMIENIGFGAMATNTTSLDAWSNLPLRPAPSIPEAWPEPIEHPQASVLWRKRMKKKPFLLRVSHKLQRIARLDEIKLRQ